MTNFLTKIFLTILAAFSIVSSALGQSPVINPGGVVNGASYAVAVSQTFHGIAPGSVASIFGTTLAFGTQSAVTTPLPLSILGTSVSVNGLPAPLFFVSPHQINFQVPNKAPSTNGGDSYKTALVTVTTPADTSRPVSVDMSGTGTGLFTVDRTGCGPGAILNVDSAGRVSPNSPTNSVSPGDFITVFGTGFGSYYMDGVPAPPPSSGYQIRGVAAFDGVRAYTYDPGGFGGWAPGLVGVNQFNFRIPLNVRQGCSVPLRITNASQLDQYSQPVTLSIHAGGGQCVDPAAAAYGQITAVRSYVTGTGNDGTFASLTAVFPSSPGGQIPPPPDTLATIPGTSLDYTPTVAPPFCTIPGYQDLNAGTLTLQLPGQSPISINSLPESAGVNYQTLFPPMAIQAQSYAISSGSLSQTGQFEVNVSFGQDIQIQSALPAPGSTLITLGTLTYSWTGGDPGSFVSVTLVTPSGLVDSTNTCVAPALAGKCSLLALSGRTLSGYTPNGELVFSVYPATPAPFSAPGLSLGGQAWWRIEHHFSGFSIL